MRRRVDYGSLIFLLVFLIVGIFAVDFVRRHIWRDMRKQPEIVSTYTDGTTPPQDDSEPVDGTTPNGMLVPPPSTTVSTDTTNAVSTPVGNKTISVPASQVYSGSLILVDSAHPQKQTPETTAFLNIAYDHFRLPTKNLTISNLCVDSIVKMFNDFYQATGFGNTMVYATMNAPTAAAYSAVIPERMTGLSIDLAVWDDAVSSHSPFTGTDMFAWIPQHCAEYGYVLRFPADKAEITGQPGCTWHYRYVGVPHASYMTQQKLCLEEYLELLKNEHTYEKSHLNIEAGGDTYEVYYVPAKAGGSATDISVPENYEVTVSGDNIGGFIITVRQKGNSSAGSDSTAPAPDAQQQNTTTTSSEQITPDE